MAAYGADNVKALVFVAGLAPDVGEKRGRRWANASPPGTLGQALAPPVPQADGAQDLYIVQAKYWSQFAADVPEASAIEMAGDPASDHAGRAQRTRWARRMEDPAVLVHLGLGRQEYSKHPSRLHGAARRGQRSR